MEKLWLYLSPVVILYVLYVLDHWTTVLSAENSLMILLKPSCHKPVTLSCSYSLHQILLLLLFLLLPILLLNFFQTENRHLLFSFWCVHFNRKTPADASNSSGTLILECAICLQTCAHPVQLSCNHIFCFLCVKGVLINLDYRCPLCRMVIPSEFLDNPKLLNYKLDEPFNLQVLEVGWFYEGSHGW